MSELFVGTSLFPFYIDDTAENDSNKQILNANSIPSILKVIWRHRMRMKYTTKVN